MLESENGEREGRIALLTLHALITHVLYYHTSSIFLISYLEILLAFPYKVLYDSKAYTSIEILIEWETFHFNNV